MALEKFRTRMFITTNLTVTAVLTASGTLVTPYATSASSLTVNGAIAVNHVSGTAKLVVRSGGTSYTLPLLGTVVGV